MNRISIQRGEDNVYYVEVLDPDGSTSNHTVTVEPEYRKKLGWKSEAEVEDLLRQSFAFLLEREPKESILPAFKLQKISEYFPEYEGYIKK